MPKAKSKPKSKPMPKTKSRSSAQTKKAVFASKSSSQFRVISILAIILFAGIGTYLTFLSFADSSKEKPVKAFVEDKQRGLAWHGLKPGKAGSKCDKLLEATDDTGKVWGCTHGPDPAPEGIDALQSVEPLAIGGPVEAKPAPPPTQPPPSTAPAITCDGDGQSGSRVQLIYAHASNVTDRYDQFASSFQQYARVMNNVFVESSQQTGSLRQVRFAQDPATCAPIVARATVSITGDDSWGNMLSELNAQGYNLASRHYMVWMDSNVYCGIGDLLNDERPTADNASNRGNVYARVDSGCWGGLTEAHELMHTFGGVQRAGPPHTTGSIAGSGGHCTDEYDRMCYPDGTTLPMTYTCPAAEENHFDCNKDDYFNSSPTIPTTNYLATHWNTANSIFLVNGGVIAPPPTDGEAPVVTITAPLNGAKIGSQVTITGSAIDNVGVTSMQIYIDGVVKATSASGSITAKWSSASASKGTHLIVVKAFDAAGNSGQSTISVIK